ncbi:MAG: AbrB/MazE/SpoVT family DNA-binding domain-containing protein [Proteobacteria bacterium]|nr:AbrB/MazE/SpoVT family DNA-binding domain-containing protein [Pseudomonadota bacterium]
MHKLKITAIGNSRGLILPKGVLDKMKVSKGDKIYLTEEPDGFHLTPYNNEFVDQKEVAEKIMREDRDVLKVLSK